MNPKQLMNNIVRSMPMPQCRAWSLPAAWASLALAALALLVSTTLLYLVVWEHGARTTSDSSYYLSGAVNLVHGNGLVIRVMNTNYGSIGAIPFGHWMPLLSLCYATLLLAGVPYTQVPSVFSLVMWVVFLVGTGTLTYQLSRSWLRATLAIVVSSFVHAYLIIYGYAMAEVLFLPLLVWLMVILVDLHQQQRQKRVIGSLCWQQSC
jgi:hypothetical protein